MTERELYILIASIPGGIYRTYTLAHSDDPAQLRLHEQCLEMEKQGQIERFKEDLFHICWKVKEAKHEPVTPPVASEEVRGAGSDAVPERSDEGRDPEVLDEGGIPEPDSSGT